MSILIIIYILEMIVKYIKQPVLESTHIKIMCDIYLNKILYHILKSLCLIISTYIAIMYFQMNLPILR